MLQNPGYATDLHGGLATKAFHVDDIRTLHSTRHLGFICTGGGTGSTP